MSARETSTDRDATADRDTARPWRGPGPATLRLVALAAVALTCGWVLSLPDPPPGARAFAGALLGLVIPGLAWCRALFPRHSLGRAERTCLVLGVQLALLVVSGFLLHLSRPGLSAATWGAFLADLSLVACLVAWWRERRLGRPGDAGRGSAAPGVGDISGVPVDVPTVPRVPLLTGAPPSQLVLLLVALMVTVAAFGVARLGVLAQPQPAWTGLSIVPAEGGTSVRIAIRNAEGHAETYRLVVSVDDEPLTTLDGLEVADDGLMIQTIPLPPAGAFLRQVRADLWRAEDDPAGPPYRSVDLALRGGGSP